MKLLIVEDERRLGARLAQGLREDGFAVDLAGDLDSARDGAIVGEHDLVILDLNLPDGSGLDLLREWRDEGRMVPVLVLTSRDQLEDKVAGLDAGADDYLTKPFEFAELLARVRALLRRRAVPLRAVLEAGELRLDRAARRATVRGEAIPLTQKELALLEQFLLQPGAAVSREKLAEHVWDESYEARSNVIDVLVGRLRRKLEAAHVDARLRAVAGVGWALEDGDAIVRRPDSLEDRVARWFAGTLVVLYGIAAVAIWGSSRQNGRQFAMLALKTEAEAVASYVAASGRLDAPELAEMEREPFPIFLRVTDGERLLSETPGSPDPPKDSPESTEDVTYWRPASGGDPMLVLRHAVGGEGGGLGKRLTVHAIGDLSPVRQLERRLATGLAVLAILMIPLSTWVGRRIARRALAPITGLVTEIRTLGAAEADRRLSVPAGAVSEVTVLAEAFNDVLARLEANLETMRRFTEDASHEIRNPLAVLRTGLEVVLRQEREPAAYRALLAENLEEIERLQSILDSLLLLARAEPGRRDLLQRQRLDLARIAAETAGRFSVVAAERRSPLVIDSPPELPLVGDPRLVRLAVFNLLDNALKHGPEGRPIRLELASAPGGARLAVVTEGAPIAAESRGRLFERYDRLSKEDRGGVGGLGLSVVRWAAEAHGGEVRYVDSENANRFEVLLRDVPAEPA